MKSLLKFATLVLCLSFSVSASAQSWGGGGSKVRMKDLIPQMSSDEAYTERYSYGIDLDGGGHIGIDFTISNLGWGDGHGAAEVRVELPDQKKYKFKKKVDKDDWSAGKNNFSLSIASTSVRAKGDGFVIKHNGKVKVELEIQNKMPMWRPGSGMKLGDDGYYKFALIAPRADAVGRVKIGDEWIDVKSTRKGYGEYTATNVAPYNMAKRLSRFRDYEGDVFVIWREIRLTEEYGGRSVAFLMIGYKDQVVFSDPKAKIKMAKLKSDGKTGYSVPYAIQLDGKSGGDSARLIMKGRSMKRKDLLASFGSAAKAVASAVSEPYQFRFSSAYTLQMTVSKSTATVKGSSDYTLDYLNK